MPELRIAIAIVLILTIIAAPIVRITVSNKTFELTYGPVALTSAASLTMDLFKGMDAEPTNLVSILREIGRKGTIPMEVNLITFLIVIFVGLLFSIPLGAILAIFSRAGFGLTLAGSIMLLFIIIKVGQGDSIGGMITPDYGIFMIMILSILGLVFGGSKKSSSRAKSKS